MNRNKKSRLKFSKILLLVIFIVLISTLGIYYNYFYPKTKVKPIDSKISLDKEYLINKFSSKNLKFSLEEINIESNIKFNNEEITDFFILTVNEIPDLKEKVTGLKVIMNENQLDLYIHTNYKKVPLEARISFTGESKNGEAIFHYKEGKLGFLKISKDTIFAHAKDTSLLKFNKEAGNIIISFKEIKPLQVYIKNLEIKNNKLELNFKGSMKLFN